MRQFHRVLSVNTILIATAVLMPCFSIKSSAGEGAATTSPRNESLVGTWRMKASAIAGSNAGAADGINTRLKIFNGTHWILVQPDPDSGKVAFVHGGTYDFDGTNLEERVEFAGEDTFELIGTSSKFRVILGDGKYEQIDPNGVFSETWERTKPRNSEKAADLVAGRRSIQSQMAAAARSSTAGRVHVEDVSEEQIIVLRGKKVDVGKAISAARNVE